MSDEELRHELRESLAGSPSIRRLVELSRLASALEAIRVAAGGPPPHDTFPNSLLALAPVRAHLEFWRGRNPTFEIADRSRIRLSYFVPVETVSRFANDGIATWVMSAPPGAARVCVIRFFPFVRPLPLRSGPG